MSSNQYPYNRKFAIATTDSIVETLISPVTCLLTLLATPSTQAPQPFGPCHCSSPINNRSTLLSLSPILDSHRCPSALWPSPSLPQKFPALLPSSFDSNGTFYPSQPMTKKSVTQCKVIHFRVLGFIDNSS